MIRSTAFFLLAITVMLLCGCGKGSTAGDDGIDWSVSLSSKNKAPYGASIAYETLPQYFPNARRSELQKLMRYNNISDRKADAVVDSPTLFIMVGLSYYISDEEWTALLRFAAAGNEVFILASNLDEHLSRAFRLRKAVGGYEEAPLSQYNDGTEAQKALRLYPDTGTAYGYTGHYLTSYYEKNDYLSADTFGSNAFSPDAYERKRLIKSIGKRPDTLGITKSSHPDFLRFRTGRGHITLHAAPLVLSNYFLLQPGNRAYLDGIWRSFPANISAVWWNEYFKRSVDSSSWSVLLKYPAIRWALLIAAVTLLLYVLFSMKRLQRIVPEIQPVQNTSVAFVETVGKLYFNKGAHANLAEKMVQHFLEWVRANYYLDTSALNPQFAKALAAKSGKPEGEIDGLLHRIHALRTGAPVSVEGLYDLYRSIQSFYKTR